MAIQGKATNEGLHLLKTNLKSKCLNVYILTSLYGDIDFELDPTKSLNQYLSEWQSLGGEYFERKIDYVYFDSDDVITFEILFKVFDDIPTTGKWVSGGIIVYDDGTSRKSVAIFSYKFYASGVADFNVIVKVSLTRDSTSVTYLDSEFVVPAYVDIRLAKLWEILGHYGIVREEGGEEVFEDRKPVSFEDLFYYFYLENTAFVKLYYDRFLKEGTVNILQGNAILDKGNSKYIITSTPCIIETSNVLEGDGGEYRSFQVHAEVKGSLNYQIQYSTDNGNTWHSCDNDKTVTFEDTFDSLKLRFIFNENCHFKSFGVVYGSIFSFIIEDIVFAPSPTAGATSIATIEVANFLNQNLTYTLSCDDPDVIISSAGEPNKFNVEFPSYGQETTVTFTAFVSSETTVREFKKTVVVAMASGDIGVFAGDSDSAQIDYITISSPGDAREFGNLIVGRTFLSATSNGLNSRGVFAGGRPVESDPISLIDYITISTPSNALEFGGLTLARYGLAATSNGINDRGIFGGGTYDESDYYNVIDYITISTLGDAFDFGDLTQAKGFIAATSNAVNDRGIFGGGTWVQMNLIDYVTISTLGDAQEFGHLSEPRGYLAATSNGVNDRGVFGGGSMCEEEIYDLIDYVTISTLGDAQEFGHLIESRAKLGATSNGVGDRGVFAGGISEVTWISSNIIDYITISDLGDASDFGDLLLRRDGVAGTSNG